MYIDTTIYITAEWTNNVCMIQTYITRHMMYINASLRGFGTQLWVLNTKVCVYLVISDNSNFHNKNRSIIIFIQVDENKKEAKDEHFKNDILS